MPSLRPYKFTPNGSLEWEMIKNKLKPLVLSYSRSPRVCLTPPRHGTWSKIEKIANFLLPKIFIFFDIWPCPLTEGLHLTAQSPVIFIHTTRLNTFSLCMTVHMSSSRLDIAPKTRFWSILMRKILKFQFLVKWHGGTDHRTVSMCGILILSIKLTMFVQKLTCFISSLPRDRLPKSQFGAIWKQKECSEKFEGQILDSHREHLKLYSFNTLHYCSHLLSMLN